MERAVSIVVASAIAIVLSGCETSGLKEAPKEALAEPLPSSLHGRGPSISPSYMSNYCKAELATRNVTTPDSVQTNSPAKAKDGSTAIVGTVHKGTDPDETFKCRFDPNGAFVDVIPVGQNGAA